MSIAKRAEKAITMIWRTFFEKIAQIVKKIPRFYQVPPASDPSFRFRLPTSAQLMFGGRINVSLHDAHHKFSARPKLQCVVTEWPTSQSGLLLGRQ